MLEDEGIVITTAAAVDIEKILAVTDIEKLQKPDGLKYLFAPLLCRNKEDQDKVYKVFDKLDAKLNEQYIDLRPDEPIIEPRKGVIVKPKKIKPGRKWYLKNVVAPSLFILIVLVAGYFSLPDKDHDADKFKFNRKIHIVVTPEQAVVNDTVHFSAAIDSSLNTQNISVDWRFKDTLIANSFTVDKVINDTTLTTVTAILKDKNGAKIDSNDYGIIALCEPPPSVSIDEADVANNGLKAASSNKKSFAPIFTNPAKDTSLYTYKWFVDDSLYTRNKILSYSKSYNKIKLVVDCKIAHCSVDSLVASVESTPALKTQVEGNGHLQIQSAYNLKNIFSSILLMLILPLIISFIAYRIIRSVKLFKPEIKEVEPGTEGPYKIEFTDQQQNINGEEGISKLADVLRKRQVSDIYKLNIRKTIRSTVLAGGIPALEFSPLSKPLSFLALIDKQHAESHLVKLFEYLVAKLEKEEVNIAVYTYEKEPLFLYNEKLNQEHIPLEKLAALYTDTTLFIFGDAQYFLYPLKGKIKPWVADKLSNWVTKFLITPYTIPDWDKKEKLLVEANFVVLPADLSSVEVIDKIISRQIDFAAQKKEKPGNHYRSRFINFQDFYALKNYLNNNYLLQWVSSLAVYPSIDWDLTIAMGKAIEKDLSQQNITINLVNYTNLLKLARISWMQDGIINESLRVAMLTYLDKDAEALARTTLNKQLQLVEASINEGSLVKPNFDMHAKLNRFLLDVYQHHKISKEDEAFISKLIDANQLDEGQDIYFESGNNTLINDPFSKNKTIGLRDYFKTLLSKRKRFSLICASVLFAALIIGMFTVLKNTTSYLNWRLVKPSIQNYTVNVQGNIFNKEVVFDLYYEPTHTKWRQQNIKLANTNFSFKYDSVLLPDTLGYGLIKLSTTDGKLLTQDSFKLNSINYNIVISEVARIPINIYYKNENGLTLANLISENLPSNYTTNIVQVQFADTIQTSVLYFAEKFKDDASNVSSTVSAVFNKNVISPQLIDSSRLLKIGPGADVAIFINEAASCTPIALTALPQSLYEIWHGGTSNRLININPPKKAIYYSVNDTKTYRTYNIDEVCLNSKGVYRIITKTNQGYKLFFIKNITNQSFDLSVCQDFVAMKAELLNKDESYCDHFNTMTLYYENDPSLVYLPVTATKLSSNEQKKYDMLINKYSDSSKSFARFIGNDDIDTKGFPYNSDLMISLIQKMPETIQSSTVFGKAGPFKRNYFAFGVNNIQSKAYSPDCSQIFYSIEETQKVASPLIVCKLDLSKSSLTSLPKEIYTFTNLAELNLGTTTIPEADINTLKKALPKCDVIYKRIESNPDRNQYSQNAPVETEIVIGDITIDNKGYVNSKTQQLINACAKQLKLDTASKIKLTGYYNKSIDSKTMQQYMNTVLNLFRKANVAVSRANYPLQITTSIQEDQQQLEKGAQSYYIATIQVTGINFPSSFKTQQQKAY